MRLAIEILGWAAFALNLAGNELLGRKRTVGWPVRLVANAGWLAYSFGVFAWPLFVNHVVFAFSNARGWWKWHREDVPDPVKRMTQAEIDARIELIAHKWLGMSSEEAIARFYSGSLAGTVAEPELTMLLEMSGRRGNCKCPAPAKPPAIDEVETCSMCPFSWMNQHDHLTCIHSAFEERDGRKVTGKDESSLGFEGRPGWCPLEAGPVLVQIKRSAR